jgi:hypothetical protein
MTKKKSTAKKSTAKKSTAKKPTAKKPTAKKPTAKKPTAKKPTAKKPTAKNAIDDQTLAPSSRPRGGRALAIEMIVAGKTNDEVQAALIAAGMDPRHKYRASWYRSRLVADGTITAEFAAAHRRAS